MRRFAVWLNFVAMVAHSEVIGANLRARREAWPWTNRPRLPYGRATERTSLLLMTQHANDYLFADAWGAAACDC